MRCLLVGLASLLLTACYINSKGRICSIAPLVAYCDYEEPDPSIPPRKMIDDWSLSGRTEEERLRDWWACGGDIDGIRHGFWAPNIDKLPSIEYFKERTKVHNAYQRCMLKRNYEYIGICPDNDLFRDDPVCLLRRGLPWDFPNDYDNFKRMKTFAEALQEHQEMMEKRSK